VKEQNVIERVYNPERLNRAWQQVRKNAGAAGIDRMSVEGFEKRIRELGPKITRKLKQGTYRFKPARRVFIPKGGRSTMRPLGIPVVMDRIVSQSINTVFEEIFAPDFTESNYGFRRGKNQHMAIRHVQELVKEGRGWCVTVDLKSFFDEIPHDLILKLIRRKIADERLVTLVARALKAGVIEDGEFHKTPKGCPQGSPLSPMLSNMVLNELDHELERRGLKYCRWADDFVILVRTERAAQRVLKGVTEFLEKPLGLMVNREKSEILKVHKVTFLGFAFSPQGKVRISEKALMRFKDRVRNLTHRNNPISMIQIIETLNEYLRGWVQYFKIQEFAGVFEKLDRWIRIRLRSMQLRKWKKPKRFQKMLIKAGIPPDEARNTWVNMKRWRSARRWVVQIVLNIEWFRTIGLVFLDDFTNEALNS
jgi:RNA-directed DNA polymerase